MSAGKSNRSRGSPDYDGLSRELKKPTDALPGSPEKIQVMMARASRRLSCDQPGDARRDRDGEPA